MQLNPKHEEMLMQLAHENGSIEQLLHTFFLFLHQKTDFYVQVPTTDQLKASKMGFLPGMAKKMLIDKFESFPYKSSSQIPNQVQSPGLSPVSPARVSAPEIRYTDEGKQIPIGNGGITPKYSWDQTLTDVTVYVGVPEGTPVRSVRCKITAQGLYVGLQNQEPLAAGRLSEKIKAGESYWSLESNQTIVISFEKVCPTWWKCVLEGDPEIDTSKVDSTRKVQEYDESTQAAIRKIMFDQSQRAKGLPTSDQLQSNKVLDMAKDLPGSPFLPNPPAQVE